MTVHFALDLRGERLVEPVRREARVAERGLFDFVMFDGSGAFVLLNAVAAWTDRIGLVAAIDPDVWSAGELARQLATLDHLSAGRAGWHPIGSSQAVDALVVACRRLWDGWAPDGVVADAERGEFVRPGSVRGEFEVPRGPQGHPELVGSLSTPGLRLIRPEELDEVVRTVVPALQAEQRYRTDYPGRLLRENLHG